MNLVIAHSMMLAYLGPGGALSAIGALLALLAAVALALVGFVWYPLKRLLGWWRERQRQKASTGEAPREVPPA